MSMGSPGASRTRVNSPMAISRKTATLERRRGRRDLSMQSVRDGPVGSVPEPVGEVTVRLEALDAVARGPERVRDIEPQVRHQLVVQPSGILIDLCALVLVGRHGSLVQQLVEILVAEQGRVPAGREDAVTEESVGRDRRIRSVVSTTRD